MDLLLREVQQLGAEVFLDLDELLDVQPLTEDRLGTETPTVATPSTTPSAEETKSSATVSRRHLILSDSIAKYLTMSAPVMDSIVNLAKGGNT